MKIYLHSTRAEQSANYVVTAAPAADDHYVDSNSPEEWKHPNGTPKQIEIVFVFGAAEVPDALGRYMVTRGFAHKSRMIRRVKQLFDAFGRAITGGDYDENGQPVVLPEEAA